MTQLSKERLEEIERVSAEFLAEEDRTNGKADLQVWLDEVWPEVTLEMARRLLAAEAQEPVAYMSVGKGISLMHAGNLDAEFKVKQGGWQPLYDAPQVAQPVQVPDEMPDSVYEILNAAMGDKAWLIADDLWNACRAAMLKQPSTIQTSDSAVPCGEIKQPASKSLQVPDAEQLLKRWALYAKAQGSDLSRHLVTETEALLSNSTQPTAERHQAAKKALLDLLHSGTASISPEPESD